MIPTPRSTLRSAATRASLRRSSRVTWSRPTAGATSSRTSTSRSHRRGRRPARPQRRRQDDELLHDRRPRRAPTPARSRSTAQDLDRHADPPARAPRPVATCRRKRRSSASSRVAENIRAVLELQSTPTAAARAARSTRARRPAATTCRSTTCATRRRRRCRAASGGASRSRARWPRSPRFILLDEPFAGVDPIAVIEIQRHHQLPEGPRHRRADHRPQRARDARHLRPRLHHQRRPGARRGHAAGSRQQRNGAQGLPRRALQAGLVPLYSSS